MSGHPPTLRRRPIVQFARRVLVLVAVVNLGADLAGTTVTAAVSVMAAIVAGIVWWARVVEPWLSGTARMPAPRYAVRRPPPAGDQHVAFAQALAYVAGRYLAQCEAQAERNRP